MYALPSVTELFLDTSLFMLFETYGCCHPRKNYVIRKAFVVLFFTTTVDYYRISRHVFNKINKRYNYDFALIF